MISSAQVRRLEEMGAKLGAIVPDGVGIFIFLKVSDGQPFRQLWKSKGATGSGGGDAKRLLSICEKRQRSVFVHNAEKDTQMSGIKVHGFLSALCTPVFDAQKEVVGTIFVTSSQPEAFSKDHKFAVERMARDYCPVLSGVRVYPVNSSSDTTAPDRSTSWMSPTSLGLVLFASVFFLVWLLSLPSGESSSKKVVVENSKPGPSVVAHQFLGILGRHRFREAYRLLSQDLQSEISIEEFEEVMSAWFHDERNRWEFQYRLPSRESKSGLKADIYIAAPPQKRQGRSWHWVLEESDDGWKIDKLDGFGFPVGR